MKSKSLIVIPAAVLGSALVIWGGCTYREHLRDRADRRASELLRTYFKLASDGYPDEKAKEQLRPVIAEMGAVSERCRDRMKEALFPRRLDGAFLVGDYAIAEAMMDQIPDKSVNWREGAKAKIRAHAALEKGRKAVAIKEFLAFCDTQLKEDPESKEFDPHTGVEWTRDGVLAHNYKRISDLAGETGDAALRDKYLAEAKKYAKVAIEKAAGDPDSKAAMEKEFAALVK